MLSRVTNAVDRRVIGGRWLSLASPEVPIALREAVYAKQQVGNPVRDDAGSQALGLNHKPPNEQAVKHCRRPPLRMHTDPKDQRNDEEGFEVPLADRR